jgi:hypothetical protein
MVSEAELARALAEEQEAVLDFPGVTGVAVGRSRDGGRAICVYVLTEEAAEAAGERARDLLPGYPIEVHVTGQLRAED